MKKLIGAALLVGLVACGKPPSEEAESWLQYYRNSARASIWLQYLREGTDYYDLFASSLRKDLERDGLTLADIGTDEAELEKLRIKGYKKSAEKWLGYLESGTDMYESFIGYMRSDLARANLTLADIAITEEKVEELRVKGCKVAAQKWLSYLREEGSRHDFLDSYLKRHFVQYLREEVRKGDLTLEEIGATEKQLRLWEIIYNGKSVEA